MRAAGAVDARVLRPHLFRPDPTSSVLTFLIFLIFLARL